MLHRYKISLVLILLSLCIVTGCHKYKGDTSLDGNWVNLNRSMNFSELYLKEGKGYSKSFLNTGKGQRSELELFFKVITHYELNSDTLILEYVTRPIKSYTRIEGVDRLIKEEPTEIKTVKWLVLEKNENYFKIQRAAVSSGTEIIEYSRMTKSPSQPSQ